MKKIVFVAFMLLCSVSVSFGLDACYDACLKEAKDECISKCESEACSSLCLCQTKNTCSNKCGTPNNVVCVGNSEF